MFGFERGSMSTRERYMMMMRMGKSSCFVYSSPSSLRFLKRYAVTAAEFHSERRGAYMPVLSRRRTRNTWFCSTLKSDGPTSEVLHNKSESDEGKQPDKGSAITEENDRVDATETKAETVAMHEKSEPPSQADVKKSKTEKLAEMLGQSRETMQAKQDKVFEERRRSNIFKYTNLAVSTTIAVALFLSEKLNPNTGLNMLRYLQNSSPSPEVIGNGRPTLVEFSASWCRTCIDMAPGMYALENDFVGRVNFVVVDAEKAENADIMEDFGVEGFPQFSLLDREGSRLTNFIGYVPKKVLAEDLNAILEGKELPHRSMIPQDFLPPDKED